MRKIAHYVSTDALALAGLIRAGDIHPREAVTAAIEQIEAHDTAVNAVTWRRYDRALREADDPLPDSPLAGVPFLIKDMGQTLTGAPNTMGSKMRRYLVADHDSALVTRHKAAGLLIVGQTSAPEFGAAVDTKPELHGATRNPWDLERSPGGSSGGAAAAVAARYVPIAHASDGGGSIRIPASVCGLFGLKPTRGRTPKGPDTAEGWFGMSIDHAVGHSVRDSAALLDLTHGPDPGAPYFAPPPARSFLEAAATPPGRLRIASLNRGDACRQMDPECVRAVESTAELLEDLGHEVTVTRPHVDAEPLREAMSLMVAADTAASIASASEEAGQPAREEHFEQAMWVIGLVGERLSARDLAGALALVKNVGREVAPFFEDSTTFWSSRLSPGHRGSSMSWTHQRPTGGPWPSSSDSRGAGLPGRQCGRWLRTRSTYSRTLRCGTQQVSPPCRFPCIRPTACQWESSSPADTPTRPHSSAFATQLEEARPWADRLPPLLSGPSS